MPAKIGTTLIDISVPIYPGMPVYPGDPDVQFEPVLQIDKGDMANVCCLHLGSQTGTHYDAPHHIINNGITIDKIPLDCFHGSCRVIKIPDSVQAITVDILKEFDLVSVERLLLKTKNSAFWHMQPARFHTDYAALTEDAAQYVADLGIRMIGIDYLSIELYNSDGLKAHKALLNGNVMILEGLDLSAVSAGDYILSALPLPYQGLDGAPTRAVLLQK